MSTGRTETDRLQNLFREFRGMDLRKPDGSHASRAKLGEQLDQMASTIFDDRAQRQNLSILQVQDQGLNTLVRRDSESLDFVFPSPKRFDGMFPARRWVAIAKQAIRLEILDCHRDDHPFGSRASGFAER